MIPTLTLHMTVPTRSTSSVTTITPTNVLPGKTLITSTVFTVRTEMILTSMVVMQRGLIGPNAQPTVVKE